MLDAGPDEGGDFLGFEEIHDLADIGLDMRRGVIVKKEKKVQQKASDFHRKLFVPDLR